MHRTVQNPVHLQQTAQFFQFVFDVGTFRNFNDGIDDLRPFLTGGNAVPWMQHFLKILS